MERPVEKRLCDWKDSPKRKPFLIFGARQIGKTYSMLCFGKEHHANGFEMRANKRRQIPHRYLRGSNGIQSLLLRCWLIDDADGLVGE